MVMDRAVGWGSMPGWGCLRSLPVPPEWLVAFAALPVGAHDQPWSSATPAMRVFAGS
jgi:hypothetical protein